MIDAIPRRKCFVALFDILGFKNLVKKSELEKVFKAYRAVKRDVEEMRGHLEALLPLLQRKPLTIHNFSDTFLIYTSDLCEQKQKEIDKTFRAMLAAIDALFMAANENELPIRGAIATGELIVSKGIEIGEPIITAYEKERKQDWIGCWVTKECFDLISEEAFNEHLQERDLVEYAIPKKEGKVEKAYALNWVKLEPFRGGSFNFLCKEDSDDWSIKRKCKNTKEFIDYIIGLP